MLAFMGIKLNYTDLQNKFRLMKCSIPSVELFLTAYKILLLNGCLKNLCSMVVNPDILIGRVIAILIQMSILGLHIFELTCKIFILYGIFINRFDWVKMLIWKKKLIYNLNISGSIAWGMLRWTVSAYRPYTVEKISNLSNLILSKSVMIS